MKVKLPGQNNSQLGMSTLEMLIALALVVIVISATITVAFSSQSVALDTLTSDEALTKGQALLEDARATARNDYSSVVTTTPITDGIYTKQTTVDPASVTECGKDVLSNVSWIGEHNRNLSVQLRTHLTDFVTAFALSHCSGTPPTGGWNPPVTYNCANFNPGKPTGLDVLNRIVYMTGDKTPYLYINDTNGAVLNSGCQTAQSPPFINFSNGFDAGAKLNDIKIARLSDGNVYAFVARDTNTQQFQVINVTDIHNPSEVGKWSLNNVATGGSFPQAFRIFYYASKVYVTARETTGPELHIFDVSSPGSISEIGNGTELNETVESMAVAKKGANIFLYAATDSNNRELDVWNVTNSSAPSRVNTAVQNLTGNQDGASIYWLNNFLYFGRESVGSGSELYIYDASNPATALTLKQQQDIDTSVIGMAIAGPFSFLATSKANAEFQVWTSDPNQTVTKVNTTPFNFPNTIYNGVVYEQPYTYVASQGNDALRILYSP